MARCYNCKSIIEVSDFTMDGARYIDGECPVCGADDVLEPIAPKNMCGFCGRPPLECSCGASK